MKDDLKQNLETVVLFLEHIQRHNTSKYVPEYVKELIESVYFKGADCLTGAERHNYQELFILGLQETMDNLFIKYRVEVDHGEKEK